ncbi:hypothetical protein [Parasitella parasitica]|uniref:C2H2-type domain-containing protein n=1 Tax=Parasitella parasitica TaxID=35722 RepID=A0A0B7NLV2_9FUNG|nr:hypothetical protein [Parasitella parasitica]
MGLEEKGANSFLDPANPPSSIHYSNEDTTSQSLSINQAEHEPLNHVAESTPEAKLETISESSGLLPVHDVAAYGRPTIKHRELKPDINDPDSYCQSREMKLSKTQVSRKHLKRTNHLVLKPLKLVPDPEDPEFHCCSCKFTCNNKTAFRDYLKRMHSIKVSEFQPNWNDPDMRCSSCNHAYKPKASYHAHCRTVHEVEAPPAIIPPPVLPALYDPNCYEQNQLPLTYLSIHGIERPKRGSDKLLLLRLQQILCPQVRFLRHILFESIRFELADCCKAIWCPILMILTSTAVPATEYIQPKQDTSHTFECSMAWPCPILPQKGPILLLISLSQIGIAAYVIHTANREECFVRIVRMLTVSELALSSKSL